MRSLDKILLPVDFSDRSVGAARYAKALALRFHSELILLHVLAPPHYEFGALEIGGTMLSQLYATRTAQIGKELDAFLASELAGVAVSRVVAEGDPAAQIVVLQGPMDNSAPLRAALHEYLGLIFYRLSN